MDHSRDVGSPDERPGDYTESEIPGDPPHVPAEPGEGRFTDSELGDESAGSRRAPSHQAASHQAEEGQYTDSELADEPGAAGRDPEGDYTDAER